MKKFSNLSCKASHKRALESLLDLSTVKLKASPISLSSNGYQADPRHDVLGVLQIPSDSAEKPLSEKTEASQSPSSALEVSRGEGTSPFASSPELGEFSEAVTDLSASMRSALRDMEVGLREASAGKLAATELRQRQSKEEGGLDKQDLLTHVAWLARWSELGEEAGEKLVDGGLGEALKES